jgi:pimeloyl-ACP methyl ester carboxylesterase
VNRLKLVAVSLALVILAATPLIADTPALKTTELGKGPAIVMLPGLCAQRMSWMPTARKLLGGYKVVLTDLPGHGDSPMPDPFSFAAAAAQLDPVLAKLNPDSTIVVAQGVGGLIAVIAAKAHPERLRGLIVIDAGLKAPIPIADQEKQQFIEFIDNNYDQFLKMMFAQMARDSAQGVEIHAKASLVPSVNVKTYMRQLMNVDESGTAKSLQIPVLFIASSKMLSDPANWPTVAKARGWDGVPRLEVRRIADSGYLIASDQPDTLAAAITEFAKKVMTKK